MDKIEVILTIGKKKKKCALGFDKKDKNLSKFLQAYFEGLRKEILDKL